MIKIVKVRKTSVTKKFTFEACHSLPNYVGACHNLHGHSYELEVTVSGEIISDNMSDKKGMIIDFKDLKSEVKSLIIDRVDHCNLNDIFPNPTAEVMANSFFSILENSFEKRGITLERIRLWETRDSYTEVTREWYYVILSRDI